MTDTKMLFGYNDKRFNEPKEILGKIKQKYTDKNIDVLGHSLGAKIAETLGNDSQVKNIITLNKPTTPKDLIQKSKINSKQYDIRTTSDLVSALQPLQTGQNDIVIQSLTSNPYTEHKIDTLSRLPQDQIIGTGLKGLNELETYLYNLIIKEYYKLMEE
jgi:predicted alpha/beta-fold hydrolase